ncbi:MAG: hypothetical protein LBE84_04960 [Planctomycetota bacterium]|nr:hypothetical protein [Planctomycetota bacterium]
MRKPGKNMCRWRFEMVIFPWGGFTIPIRNAYAGILSFPKNPRVSRKSLLAQIRSRAERVACTAPVGTIEDDPPFKPGLFVDNDGDGRRFAPKERECRQPVSSAMEMAIS